MEAYHCEAEEVFVVTLSSHLSGSYNSAELGRKLCKRFVDADRLSLLFDHAQIPYHHRFNIQCRGHQCFDAAESSVLAQRLQVVHDAVLSSERKL